MNALIAALSLGLGLSSAQASDGNPLLAERWQSRPLIVIVPDAQDSTLLGLRTALAAPDSREAFVEREMVLYEVIAGHASRNGQPLDAGASAALLKAVGHSADAGPRVLLVGKDGGIKVDQPGPVDPHALVTTIDRMPMRQGQ
jgi:hypothetical protein